MIIRDSFIDWESYLELYGNFFLSIADISDEEGVTGWKNHRQLWLKILYSFILFGLDMKQLKW